MPVVARPEYAMVRPNRRKADMPTFREMRENRRQTTRETGLIAAGLTFAILLGAVVTMQVAVASPLFH